MGSSLASLGASLDHGVHVQPDSRSAILARGRQSHEGFLLAQPAVTAWNRDSDSFVHLRNVEFVYHLLIKRAPEIKNHKANFVATLIACVFIYNFYGLLLYVFGLKGMGYPYRFFKA